MCEEIKKPIVLECPFCGVQEHEEYNVSLRQISDVQHEYTIGYEVYCPSCGVSMGDEYLDDLLDKWNTRHDVNTTERTKL